MQPPHTGSQEVQPPHAGSQEVQAPHVAGPGPSNQDTTQTIHKPRQWSSVTLVPCGEQQTCTRDQVKHLLLDHGPVTDGSIVQLTTQFGDAVAFVVNGTSHDDGEPCNVGTVGLSTDVRVRDAALGGDGDRRVNLSTFDAAAKTKLGWLVSELVKEKVHLPRAHSILVEGPRGSGKTTLVLGTAAEFGVPVVTVSAIELYATADTPNESDRHFQQLANKALQHQPAILLIDDAQLLFYQGESTQSFDDPFLLLQFLSFVNRVKADDTRVLIVAISSDVGDLQVDFKHAFEEHVSVSIPSPQDRKNILSHCLKHHSTSDDVTTDCISVVASQCHGFVGSDFEALCAQAMSAANKTGATFITAASLHAAKAGYQPLLLRGQSLPWQLISPGDVRLRFDQIGGLAHAKQSLKEMVVWPATHTEHYRAFGIDAPRGIILYGPPGTGKTMLARAVAKEANSNFLSVSISDIIRGQVGESEKIIAQVFAVARRCAPCIVFFDEFQALFGTRSNVGGVGHKLVSQFILETDRLQDVGGVEHRVVLMGATNALDAIDPVLLRPGRFDRQILIAPPDEAARRQILQACSKRMGCWDGTVDLERLVQAMSGKTGAEIENVCQKAALERLKQMHGGRQLPGDHLAGFQIGMADFDAVLDKSSEKSGGLFGGGVFASPFG